MASAGNQYIKAFHDDADSLMACPACDTLHSVDWLDPGQVAQCSRCHHTLIAPRQDALNRTMAYSLATAILMVTMLAFPFLRMSQAGLSNQASVLQIIATLADGWFLSLSIAVAVFVIAIPLTRAATLFYVMWALKQRHIPGNVRKVFLMSERLAPWAMTEIFIIGTGVALVKVAGLANVTFGVAFWLFCTLVLVIALQNASVCRWTVWALIRKGEDDARL